MNVDQMIERIDLLAKKQGMSRNKLLTSCGVKAYVDNLKRGQIPKLDTTAKIADYLNISIDYLAGRTDNPEINP
ncbi:MAG: helix-turn-helix transcriptional regulator [Oscillospiraceae bacterium]|nr:helix-turn-helix transcriptional regulator [Oscillospiraceae bacterium]